MHFSLGLRKLPGVLEVEKFPKVYLNHPDPGKAMGDAIVQSGGCVNNDLLPWVVENPANLRITINLHAPSRLIRFALDFLIEACKTELVISDGDVDSDMIRKYLAAWDLQQQGEPVDQISKKIALRKYKSDHESRGVTPEMIEFDSGLDGDTYYKVNRIIDYIKEAEAMIQKGRVI